MRILMLIGALLGAPALAEPAPTVAPAGAWVEPLAIPAPDPALAGKPLQMLLISAQSRYGEVIEHYVEGATIVQTAQGLTAMGTIALPWQPDRGDLIVHKVQILRDGNPIDLLAGGQGFTVLRRENNLASAVLDGVLTAVMQPEGLAVGDIVHIAFTIRAKKGVLPLRGENYFSLMPDASGRRIAFRQVWDDDMPMRWRGTGQLAKPRLGKSRWGNELMVDLADPKIPKIPEHAPPRYYPAALLEVSGYGDWAEISRMMAPAYASSRTIAADSPLRAEIARIAASSTDQGQRALAALRLVQDKIRYMALAMGEGGLIPATADQTWARKFGDCKGKTTTLLALLDGLGIEAEPMAVSLAHRSGIGDRLPQVSVFDHVIVRARIGDRWLWLDGTNPAQRSADDIASSGFGFGLPLVAAGAQLERLPAIPPTLPLQDFELTYDASAGFENEVPVSGTVTYRGGTASNWRAYLSLQGETATREALTSEVPGVPDEDVEIATVSADEEANSFSFTFSGKTRMAWTRDEPSKAIKVKFHNDVISWTIDFKREDGPGKDIPFHIGFPVYQTSRETVILPNRGAGYRVEATSFDREVAGTRIARTVSIAGDKAVAVSTFLRLRDEISAAEAAAAIPVLAKINDDAAYIRSPDDYRIGALDAAPAARPVPAAAAGSGASD